MSRVAYVEGRYVPHRAAAVQVEDRRYQFVGGHRVDEAPHLVRLARSLSEPRMPTPMSDAALKIVMSKSSTGMPSATASSISWSPAASPRATMPCRNR
jgi:hypothetical protein